MAASGQPWLAPEHLDSAEYWLQNALSLGSGDARLRWALAIILWKQGDLRAAEEAAHRLSQDIRSLALLPRLSGDALPGYEELMEACVVSLSYSGIGDVVPTDDHFDSFVPEADCDGPVWFQFDMWLTLAAVRAVQLHERFISSTLKK